METLFIQLVGLVKVKGVLTIVASTCSWRFNLLPWSFSICLTRSIFWSVISVKELNSFISDQSYFANTASLNHYHWGVTDLNISLQFLPCTFLAFSFLACTFLACTFLAWTFLLLWCYFLNITWFRLRQSRRTT